MKLSKLIEDLQRVLENTGDLKVCLTDEDGIRNYEPTLHVYNFPSEVMVISQGDRLR